MRFQASCHGIRVLWVFVHVKSSNSISFGTEEGKSKYWKKILVGFGKYARSMKIIENHIENPCFSCGLPHDSRLATKCPAPRQGWDIATRQQRRLGDTSFLQSRSSLSFFCSCTYKNGHWWRSTIKPHAVPQSHISTKTHFAATWHIHDPFLHEPGGPAVTWRNQPGTTDSLQASNSTLGVPASKRIWSLGINVRLKMIRDIDHSFKSINCFTSSTKTRRRTTATKKTPTLPKRKQ